MDHEMKNHLINFFPGSRSKRLSFEHVITISVIATLALSCTGWIETPARTSHVIHQIAAAIAGFFVFLVYQAAWRDYRHHLVVLPLATMYGVVFAGQIFVGAMEATNPSRHLSVLHSLTAITVWILAGTLYLNRRPSKEDAYTQHQYSDSHSAKDFLILTKPWIVALLLITTLTGLVMGYQGPPPFPTLFWTLLGGALAAGGSSALNQYIDSELDKHMQRTANRPLAAGRLTKAEGLAFGLALCVASYYILAVLVNLLAATLSLIGIFYYVFLYSIWLKKLTVQNIVIGGGAGSIPPMVGWAAATGHLPLAAWLLFAIIFIWTPPHFWALAIVRKKDYERAGVPMLPVVRGEEETRKQILLYTLLLVGVSLLLPALHLTGSIYLISALMLGSGLIYAAWRVWRVPGNRVAHLMYRWSSYYLLFIFIALMLDAVYSHG
jgi:heme o synthase